MRLKTQTHARLLITSGAGAKRVSYWDKRLISGVYVFVTDALAESGVVATTVELQYLKGSEYRTVSIWDRFGRRRVGTGMATSTRGEE